MKQTHLIFDSSFDAIDDYRSMRSKYKKAVDQYKYMIWYGFADYPLLR